MSCVSVEESWYSGGDRRFSNSSDDWELCIYQGAFVWRRGCCESQSSEVVGVLRSLISLSMSCTSVAEISFILL